jgi:hypothetical protein
MSKNSKVINAKTKELLKIEDLIRKLEQKHAQIEDLIRKLEQKHAQISEELKDALTNGVSR